MANLTEILESSLFLWGLLLGAGCLVGMRFLTPRLKSEPPYPFGGMLVAIATIIAWALADEISVVVWLGLATVVALTAAVGRVSARPEVIGLASLPGAIILAFAAPSDPWWFRLVVVLSIPVGGFLVDEFDTRYRHLGLGMLFYGLACLGSFLAVPDTELPRALIAVALPIMFLAWPKVMVTLGRTGGYAAIAVFTLATVTGGVGRPASVIGAMACLGLMILEPIMVRVRPLLAHLPDWLHRTPEAAVMATIPQVVLVFVASRVAGLMVSIVAAMVTVLVLSVLFALLLLWTERSQIPASYDDR